MDKTIDRIVITGGSAEERQSAISTIVRPFLAKGYTVFTVPNSMEELEQSGITPEVLRSPEAFVTSCLELQFAREYVESRAAAAAPGQKVLIICDGGAMDSTALLGAEEWEALLAQHGLGEAALRDSYDAVFCLADDPESTQKAADAWAGNPHLRIIEWKDAEYVQDRLVKEICAHLGDPEPLEIERRYLIRYPDLAWLTAQHGCRAVQIEQAYLQDGVRLRKRGGQDGYIYFETVKRGEGARRLEMERRISEEEYRRLLAEAGGSIRWIRKTRYCLVYEAQYLEIDVYPFWKDKAILEVELLHEDDAVEIPPEIHVIRDVTGDSAYSNYALSQLESAQ